MNINTFNNLYNMSCVIIYTYYNTDVANYNFSFFAQNELKYRDNIDYIIVINGFSYDEKIILPDIKNLTLLRRENVGYDFGGHNAALEYLEGSNKKYDYYFFMNSGVFGPVLPHYFTEHWSTNFIKKINCNVKLIGTTIVCLPKYGDPGGFGPKVEGFFFMVDQIGLDILIKEGTIFCNHDSKNSAIVNGEYGLTNSIFKNGYSIDCMVRKYQNIEWRDEKNWHFNNYSHISRKDSCFGHSIIPYEVIFHKWYWHDKEMVNFELIDQYVNNCT